MLQEQREMPSVREVLNELKAAGKSDKEIAQFTQVNRSTITRIKNGDTHKISIDIYLKMLKLREALYAE